MRRIRKLSRGTMRRLLSLVVFLGICAMVLPLPVAIMQQEPLEKDSSEPFPCQNRPCGCRTAEQCWKKCCCFNNSQKIAWAKANQVKVPGYVLAAAVKEKSQSFSGREVCSLQNGMGQRIAKAAACPHCTKKTPEAEQSVPSSGGSSSIAVKGSGDVCVTKLFAKSAAPSLRAKSVRLKWMMSVYSAECQGQGASIFCLPLSIVPESPRMPSPDVVTVETFELESERLKPSSLRPPLPPPKIV